MAGACSTAEPASQHGGGAIGATSDAASDAQGAPEAGAIDGGAPPDLGAPDADTPTVDAGSHDAGAAEAGGTSASHPGAYEAESGALFGQAKLVACAPCSGGHAVTYAPDSGFTLSNVWAPVTGTNALVITYVNADKAARSLYLGLNGDVSQMLMATFPPTGGAVASLSVPLAGFKAGPNNMLTFFIDTELLAPDVDRIAVVPTTISSTTGNACANGSWKATASVTAGDGGGPAAAIDGNLTTRWANNRAQDGTDWFQVDFGALVKLPKITLDNSQAYPDDYPGNYAVYASLDGVTFEAMPFVTGAGTTSKTVISFSQRTVRAIKIVQVGAARATHWWQIGELEVVCYQ